MSALYWFINLCLLAVAAGMTVWLGGSDPQQMFQQPEEVEDLNNDQTEGAIDDNTGDDAGPTLDEHPDTLWQRTLFRPERTEAVPLKKGDKDENDEPAKPEREPVDMELTGLGRIGDKSAAVIRVKEKRRSSQETDDLKKNVYRLDESVRDTGFKVSSIAVDGVTLSRGDETRELTLTKSDAASEKRREQAVQARKEREKERKKRREEREEETPEPPPPPPAPTGGESDAEDRRAQAEGKQQQEEEEEKTLEHTVMGDETVHLVADMYGTSVDKIMKANEDIDSPGDLEADMTITVPYE